MIKLSKPQIQKIASELEIGMKCFYNKKTGDIKSVIDFGSWIDEDLLTKDLKHIQDNWSDYIEFNCMETHDTFDLMADFVRTVDEKSLRKDLINALNNRKPFANFKWHIDNSDEYAEKWSKFKSKRFLDWVGNQIKRYNNGVKVEQRRGAQ